MTILDLATRIAASGILLAIFLTPLGYTARTPRPARTTAAGALLVAAAAATDMLETPTQRGVLALVVGGLLAWSVGAALQSAEHVTLAAAPKAAPAAARPVFPGEQLSPLLPLIEQEPGVAPTAAAPVLNLANAPATDTTTRAA